MLTTTKQSCCHGGLCWRSRLTFEILACLSNVLSNDVTYVPSVPTELSSELCSNIQRDVIITSSSSTSVMSPVVWRQSDELFQTEGRRLLSPLYIISQPHKSAADTGRRRKFGCRHKVFNVWFLAVWTDCAAGCRFSIILSSRIATQSLAAFVNT